MARTHIFSGRCGYSTDVEATRLETDNGDRVRLAITSDCNACRRLAQLLTEVDPIREITYRGQGPLVLSLAAKTLTHTACPVPSGIIKAIEVAAGLALPLDASIQVFADGNPS